MEEDSHEYSAKITKRSFLTEPYRSFTVTSPIPVTKNRITFIFCCKTTTRNIVANDYSTYVLAQHQHQRTKNTLVHDLRKSVAPDVRGMFKAIERELRQWSLPQPERVEMIRKVIDETMSIVKSCKRDNNFVVKVNVRHKHDRISFESVPRMVPSTEESIKNLEHTAVTGEVCCSICQEEMATGCVAAKMPCLHAFHCDCIETWLKTSHYCPLCRYPMPIESSVDSCCS